MYYNYIKQDVGFFLSVLLLPKCNFFKGWKPRDGMALFSNVYLTTWFFLTVKYVKLYYWYQNVIIFQVESDISDDADVSGVGAEEDVFTVEGKLLRDSLVKFQLATPSPMPTHLNVHFICETASRLLFLSIHWVRSIPAFTQLKWVLDNIFIRIH